MRALEKIADAPAVDAIISHIASKDEDTASAARGALERIHETTTDPMIKAKIEFAGK